MDTCTSESESGLLAQVRGSFSYPEKENLILSEMSRKEDMSTTKMRTPTPPGSVPQCPSSITVQRPQASRKKLQEYKQLGLGFNWQRACLVFTKS